MIELAGSIIIEDGKLLLLYRNDEQHWESQRSQGESCSTSNLEGCWRVPGGKVEEEESPTETAIREASEEIGVEVELERPFYTGEFQQNGKLFEWNSYIASVQDERPEIQEDKFEEIRWFSKEEFEACESLAPNLRMVKHGLKRLLEN